MRRGVAERQTQDYHRRGATNKFAALHAGSGHVIEASTDIIVPEGS